MSVWGWGGGCVCVVFVYTRIGAIRGSQAGDYLKKKMISDSSYFCVCVFRAPFISFACRI